MSDSKNQAFNYFWYKNISFAPYCKDLDNDDNVQGG